MFIKPFKIKSNVQLKASEKKKFRGRVLLKYPLLTEDEINLIIPSKSSLFNVKILTHNDNNILAYCVDKRPMFFEEQHECILMPTVYTLWLVPNLVPQFTTHPGVFPKLSNGADLMIPGVVKEERTLQSWGRYGKNQIACVNLTSNKAAVGVGILAHSSEDLYMCGGHGICVKMLHVYGDKLWSIEPTVCLQVPNSEAVFCLPKSEDFPSLSDSHAKPIKPKVTNNNTLEPSVETNVSSQQDIAEICDQINETEISSIPLTDLIENIDPIAQMDNLLKKAFLTALKLNGSKLQLPLLTSNFYRLHVLPVSKTPIEIKNTSYKKLSKFLMQMANEGFITVREETKGVEKLIDVSMDHPEIKAFIPDTGYDEDKDKEAQLFSASVTELYAITEQSYDFFKHFNLQKGRALDKNEIMKYIKEYVANNKLQLETSSKKIKMDDNLLKICESNNVTDINKLLSVITSKMDLTYEMRNHGIVTAGKKPVVQITLANRSGNKKVTLVNNLESYGIIIPEFAKACKLGAAASTSITRPPGFKSDQLMVQGNQVKFIHNLLTQTYKVQAQHITGLELAKKEKKKKN